MSILHHMTKGLASTSPVVVPQKVSAEMERLMAEPKSPSANVVVLDDFAKAVGSPRGWAKKKAEELASHPALADLGMSSEEREYWLKQLAEKWRRRARENRTKT